MEQATNGLMTRTLPSVQLGIGLYASDRSSPRT